MKFKDYFVIDITKCKETTFAQLIFSWSNFKVEIRVKKGK